MPGGVAEDPHDLVVVLVPADRLRAGLFCERTGGVEVVDRATVEHRVDQQAERRRHGVGGGGVPARRVRTLDLIGDIAPW